MYIYIYIMLRARASVEKSESVGGGGTWLRAVMCVCGELRARSDEREM